MSTTETRCWRTRAAMRCRSPSAAGRIDHDMAELLRQRDEIAFGIDDRLLDVSRALFEQPAQAGATCPSRNCPARAGGSPAAPRDPAAPRRRPSRRRDRSRPPCSPARPSPTRPAPGLSTGFGRPAACTPAVHRVGGPFTVISGPRSGADSHVDRSAPSPPLALRGGPGCGAGASSMRVPLHPHLQLLPARGRRVARGAFHPGHLGERLAAMLAPVRAVPSPLRGGPGWGCWRPIDERGAYTPTSNSSGGKRAAHRFDSTIVKPFSAPEPKR